MSEATITLLSQIPLAGVVVIVVMIFLSFIGKYNTTMMTFLQTQQDASQKFISEQRELSNSALGRLAEEIKSISGEVARMNGVLSAHEGLITHGFG